MRWKGLVTGWWGGGEAEGCEGEEGKGLEVKDDEGERKGQRSGVLG